MLLMEVMRVLRQMGYIRTCCISYGPLSSFQDLLRLNDVVARVVNNDGASSALLRARLRLLRHKTLLLQALFGNVPRRLVWASAPVLLGMVIRVIILTNVRE